MSMQWDASFVEISVFPEAQRLKRWSENQRSVLERALKVEQAGEQEGAWAWRSFPDVFGGAEQGALVLFQWGSRKKEGTR